QLFAGTFGRCLINVDNSTLANVTNKTECDNMGYYWRNPVMNFDNLGNALISLFHIATLDGWKRLMKSAVDARGKDLQPKSLNNLPARLFFIAFIVVGVFLTLNLIAGVIIDQFYSSRKKYISKRRGNSIQALFTESQLHWYRMMKRLMKAKLIKSDPPPTFKWQKALVSMFLNKKYELFSMTVVVLNIVAMMFIYYQQSAFRCIIFLDALSIADILNYGFTCFYTLECILKFLAFRIYFFKDIWNIFDLIIVLASITGIVLSNLASVTFRVSPAIIRAIRIFRIVRMIRLLRHAQGMRRLLMALIASI
ncbi:uncharacterized protein TRIADDRAFT_4247, partial [Trichoplax adhaerens]